MSKKLYTTCKLIKPAPVKFYRKILLVMWIISRRPPSALALKGFSIHFNSLLTVLGKHAGSLRHMEDRGYAISDGIHPVKYLPGSDPFVECIRNLHRY